MQKEILAPILSIKHLKPCSNHLKASAKIVQRDQRIG